MSVGQAVFLKADQLEIEAGPEGLKALLAYPDPHADSMTVVEERRTQPEHPRSETKEVQTWLR